MEEYARRCSELIRPSTGPYLEVPHMGPEDARRVVSQLRSGLSGPIAAAINALTVISADATDPMSTQDWPGLAGALCEVVRGGLEFDAGRGGTPGWTAAGAGRAAAGAVEDHALWAEVEALAGTNEPERAFAGELAAAALNVLRNLSLTPGNRAAMAMDADGALAPLLVRYVAAFNAGSDAESGGTNRDPRAAADAADVLVNLAWLDDDAPLNAPCLLRPTRRLADAALGALEAPRVPSTAHEIDDATGAAADDWRESAAADADLRCAAAGLLGFAATGTIEECSGWRDESFASRAVRALASNVNNFGGFGGFGGSTAVNNNRGGEDVVNDARMCAACVRALHAMASSGGDGAGASAGAVASHPSVIPSLVELAARRGGTWRECRVAALDAVAAAALSEGGRRRLSAHEEDLLRLAVEDRGLAEGPVMLTVSRIAEGNKGR